jgi:hypothetical protein
MKSAQVTVVLMDGRELVGRTSMRDVIAYETTSKKQKPPWGGISESPGRWESFVTWSMLRRTGQIGDQGYEAFVDDVDSIEFEFEDVDPTSGANGATPSPTSP